MSHLAESSGAGTLCDRFEHEEGVSEPRMRRQVLVLSLDVCDIVLPLGTTYPKQALPFLDRTC